MIALVLSVASSSIIFVLFKLFSRFKIDTFQAIVFNYFTAFAIGVGLYGNEWTPEALQTQNWIPFAIVCSLLFIGLFFIMGRSSQVNGVASTSVAVKMSMAVSLIMMIVWYSEPFSLLKALGILLAFIGVFLVSYSKNSNSKSSAPWMLLLLFIGSGALDFTLNYAQKYELGALSTSLFSAIGLGLAGCLGTIFLLIQLLQGKTTIHWRNIIAGIVLGIPNYFSIYLLLLSYKTTGWNDSTVLAITNVSVVLTSAFLGFIAFKENASRRKVIGLISAILAIVILYISNLDII